MIEQPFRKNLFTFKSVILPPFNFVTTRTKLPRELLLNNKLAHYAAIRRKAWKISIEIFHMSINTPSLCPARAIDRANRLCSQHVRIGTFIRCWCDRVVWLRAPLRISIKACCRGRGWFGEKREGEAKNGCRRIEQLKFYRSLLTSVYGKFRGRRKGESSKQWRIHRVREITRNPWITGLTDDIKNSIFSLLNYRQILKYPTKIL